VVVGGRLYAIGGRSGCSDDGGVDVYDPTKDARTSGPSIPLCGTGGATV
jgi:hypothetical protein